jgi:hypothetical protein
VTPINGHGLCGDAAGGRDHMAGGKFGRTKTSGTPAIVGSYEPGAIMTTQVVLTAHHDGFFEWRLCDVEKYGDNPSPQTVRQDCFDRNVLELVDWQNHGMKKADWKLNSDPTKVSLWGNDDNYQSKTKWVVPPAQAWSINRYTVQLRLPNVNCKRCVVQWYYQTGNSASVSYPEEFWNCADIEIAPLADQVFKITPTIAVSSQSSQELMLATSCGLSGTPSVQKCFSTDVRVTDKWCDSLKCDGAFGSLCRMADVDADCAIKTPIIKAGFTSAPTPLPTYGKPVFSSTLDSSTSTYTAPPAKAYVAPVWNSATYSLPSTYSNPSASGGSMSAGTGSSCGKKTVTTTTATTTSTYH